MKRLHTTTYKLYNKDNIRISILSDIHFSHKVKNKLDKLLKHLYNIILCTILYIIINTVCTINIINKLDDKKYRVTINLIINVLVAFGLSFKAIKTKDVVNIVISALTIVFASIFGIIDIFLLIFKGHVFEINTTK